MKFIDEYRDKALIVNLADQIRKSATRDYKFMEVCGGHTNAIHRFGIPALLPGNILLVSGPGCPVCVTGQGFIDKVIDCSKKEKVIITTFGDLLRVPGSSSSLEKAKSEGADIRIVLSGLDALEIASQNPGKRVIFPGIGFETTAPGSAVIIKEAKARAIKNFFLFSSHKIMPPAMEALIKDGVTIDGFICPGHVAAITGSVIFDFIPEKYNLGCVITGFEPSDIMHSILMLISQVNNKAPKVEIQYTRAVSENGNLLAKKLLSEVFEASDDYWRGFGVIAGSGLQLRKEFEEYDAAKVFNLQVIGPETDGACICGEILRGMKNPAECPLFAGKCIPENPVGACMVSNEGACNTWYKYVSHE